MANELRLRNVSFEVDDLQATVDRLCAEGYGLVGGIGQYENLWRMAYVRGPEGIIVFPGGANRLTRPEVRGGVRAGQPDLHAAVAR